MNCLCLASIPLDVRLGAAIHRKYFGWRLPIFPLRFLVVSFCFLVISLGPFFAKLPLNASGRSLRPPQDIHSLVSQKRLTPPLHSPEASLRFSPDGHFLLFQDLSGIIVMSKDPLNIVLRVSAEDIYPAQFSRDSRSVTIISRALNFGRWRLPDGQKMEHGSLAIEDGCLEGQLSPDGVTFACIRADFKLALYEISTQKVVFDISILGPRTPSPGRIGGPLPMHFINFLWLDFDSPFARPFGLVRTSIATPNPSQALSRSAIHFSPDGKVLIAGTSQDTLGLELDSRKRFDLSDALKKALRGAIDLQGSERAIAVEMGSKSEAVILSLKDGKVLSHPAFMADRIRIATNPRYAILYNLGAEGSVASAFDLEQSRVLEVPPSLSIDICDQEMAVYNFGGSVALYRLGEHRLLASLPLPLGRLSEVRAASVTPDLKMLAVSVPGAGAIFEIESGRRVGSFAKFSAANFPDQQTALLFLPKVHQDPARVSRVETSTGESSTVWTAEKELQLRSGGSVLLGYSLKQESIRAPLDFPVPEMQVPFRLRGLDPASGRELWKRDFEEDPPTPFADPQGERLVLGWRAKSYEAKEAASRNPAVRTLYKSAKLTDRDSFFEAVDARSGKPLGGVLAQAGNGPTSFDAAFSVADVMVLVKDGVRVSIYSLRDGNLKARLVGVMPSASAQSNLLSLELGPGRLGIFDLNTGTKLDEQKFPEEIVYIHFSGDGNRLFVLTEHQAAVILDVSKVREEGRAIPEAPKEGN